MGRLRRHVLFIGIDGVRPDALALAATPVLDAIVKGNGTYSFHGQISTDIPVSAPSWSSIFTGKTGNSHGVLNNRWIPACKEPNVVQLLRRTGDVRAHAVAGGWIGTDGLLQNTLHDDLDFAREYADPEAACTHPHPPQSDMDNHVHLSPHDAAAATAAGGKSVGEDTVTQGEGMLPSGLLSCLEMTRVLGFRAAQLRAAADVEAAYVPEFNVLYINEVDHAGHSYGFAPHQREYIKSIETVDGWLAPVLAAVTAREAALAEEWLVVFTTDHGGTCKADMRAETGLWEEYVRLEMERHAHLDDSAEFCVAPLAGVHGVPVPQHTNVFVFLSGSGVGRRGEILPAPRSIDLVPTMLAFMGVSREQLAAWHLDGTPIDLAAAS